MCNSKCSKSTRNHTAQAKVTVRSVALVGSQSRRYADSKVGEVKRCLNKESAERVREEERASKLRFAERVLFILLGLAIELVLSQFFALPEVAAKVIIVLPELARETFERRKRL
jgi:hypothetical protein